MNRVIGRREFLRFAARASLGVAAALSGCDRIGLSGPTELPPPEEQGLVSRKPESLYAPHGRPDTWFNPWWSNPNTTWGYWKMKLFYRNEWIEAKSRPPNVPRVENDGAYLAKPERSTSIAWVGHCTFVVKDGSDTWLTDPHFGERAFWPKRWHPPGVPVEKIPPDAFAVLSHNHYDHMSAWTVEALPETVAWFVPMGLADWFRDRGRRRVVELDWWQSARHGRWKVTCLPAQHWSNRFGMGRDSTLWCSWLVESERRKFFFAGDTGYFHGFAEYGRKFGPIDAAMLPIGAYAPRWFMRYSHLSPAEAYRAFRELRARWMLPMHWGTFDLTDEPIDQPPKELSRVVRRSGGDPGAVRTLAVGERWHMMDGSPALTG
ncbi:MAG: MBL fold metallo-hydrolase [Nitrospinota bacterium]